MRFPKWPRGISLISGPVETANPKGPLSFFGAEIPAFRPVVTVKEGQKVAAGSILFHDRKRPWIAAVSPVAGIVSRLDPGPRRSIAALEITPDGEKAISFDLSTSDTREGLIDLMVKAGLWPSIKARPFGKIGDPADVPEALFITATEAFDGAPDPGPIIASYKDAFRRGLRALPVLGAGRTCLCHAEGLPVPDVPGITTRAFSGGLPGDHIHTLHPVAHGGMVWQIGWQEVIALGYLLETGRIWGQRILSVSGPAATRPGLVAATPGARLHHIAAGKLADAPLRLLAGSVETGVATPFLTPGVRQITALFHHEKPAHTHRLNRMIKSRRPALIPNFWDETASPRGILPIPLLRALAAGDAETARDLGVLGLVEEDIAALNYRFGGRGRNGVDYTVLLRQTLDELETMA